MALARSINLCTTTDRVVQRFRGEVCSWKIETPEMWLDPVALVAPNNADSEAQEVITWFGEPLHAISLWYTILQDVNNVAAVPPAMRFLLDAGCDGKFRTDILTATLAPQSFNPGTGASNMLFGFSGVLVDSFRLRARMLDGGGNPPAIRIRMNLTALIQSACGATEFQVPVGGNFTTFP